MVSFKREFKYVFVKNIKFDLKLFLKHSEKFLLNVLKYEDILLFQFKIMNDKNGSLK